MNSTAIQVVEHDEDTQIEARHVDARTLRVAERGEIDAQVATARAFPRSVTAAKREALELATLDEDTAGSMFYALPRGGKTLEGPSVRLAEIMAYSWGNMRSAAEVVGEEPGFVVAEATCFDCEKNVAVRVRVKRRITDKNGKRFNDDMIGVTGNAATSIALRNAIFKVIPAVFVRQIYQEARRASLGKGGTLTQKRQKALDWFGKLGKKPEDVYALLGVVGLDDVGEEELIRLRGYVTAIQDGETTVEQLFAKADGKSEGATSLNDAIPKTKTEPKREPAKGKAKAPPAPTQPEPEPPLTKFLLETPKTDDDTPASVYIELLEEHAKGAVALTPEDRAVAEAYVDSLIDGARGCEPDAEKADLVAKAKAIVEQG